jgi:hypothetical protein
MPRSKKQIAKIVAAVKANRGGHAETSDAQILTIWDSLNKQTQDRYLQSQKTDTGKE